MTVYENVAFALECVGMKEKEIRPMVMSALERVGLKHKVRAFPGELSGGEQQRVSIARAVAKKPSMLLCDEPTGALDSKTGVSILNLLQNMSVNNNSTVVIVTHNAILAEAADKVIRIKNGKIESITINENPKKVTDLEWWFYVV